MTGARSGAEAARLADAGHVVHGERGDGARGRMLYGVYVTTLLVATYGFTLARGIFLTAEPRALHRELTSPVTAVLAVVVLALLVGVARTSGRTRGPVVPPLPWIDHVVTTDVDRARAVRPWWRYAAVGGLAAGTILGAALGAGAWAATVGGPLWLVVGVLAGPVVGWSLVLAWLSGQVSAGAADLPGTARPRAAHLVRVDGALRLVGIEELRRQAARSTRLGGGILAGDLRAVRLEVAPPVSRGRRLRLRPGGPWLTVARRDALGLRRAPGTVLAGAALTLLGAAGLAWSVEDPAAPAALGWLAAAAAYLGFGTWAEGLRLQGDNGGTTPLLGVWGRREALAHLLTPCLLVAVVGGAGVLATTLARSAPPTVVLAAVAWLVVVNGTVAGAQLLAAFRGQPPRLAFVPETGPFLLALWYARPLLVALVGAGAFLGAADGTRLGPLVPAAVVSVLTVLWGLSRVEALELAHRE